MPQSKAATLDKGALCQTPGSQRHRARQVRGAHPVELRTWARQAHVPRKGPRPAPVWTEPERLRAIFLRVLSQMIRPRSYRMQPCFLIRHASSRQRTHRPLHRRWALLAVQPASTQ